MNDQSFIEFDTPCQTTIQVFWQKGDEPFITAANGPITLEAMTELSEECQECIPETFDEGDGDYLFSTRFNQAQIGEHGQIEIPAHWELDLLKFRSMDES